MSGPHLIYFTDPMCSWCWGFAPVIGSIEARFGDRLPIRVVVGGLRPGTTAPLDAKSKEGIRGHWHHVHEASGQPFDDGFFAREGFVYDTEPAARAVVIMRRAGMGRAITGLHRIQEAFYAQNIDVTRTDELVALAAGLGFDAGQFREDMESEAARQETWQDFAISHQTGVTGFPTLIAGAGEDNQYAIVAQGFQQSALLVPALERWLKGVRSKVDPLSSLN